MDPFKARRENMCVMLEQACQQAKREYDNPQATSMSPDSRHALVAEKPVIVFDRVIFDLMKEPELLNKKVYLRLLKLDKQIFGVPFYHNVTHSLLSVYPLEIAQRIECRGADFPSVYTWMEWFVKSMKANEVHASHGRPDLYGKRKELEESISNLLSILSPQLSDLPEHWKVIIPPGCLAQWNAQKQAEALNEVVPSVARSGSSPRI